jgi:hypothetical protein
MSSLRMVIAAGLAGTLLLAVPSSAQARQILVEDPAGDTIDPGLDMTSATFRNRDRAVVVTIAFTRDRRGEVIVAVDGRTRPPVRIVSQHRRQGPDRTFLITRTNDEAPCRGLSSDWDRAEAVVQLRMPARCLGNGNYGALRFWVLTEGAPGSSSSDVDYAPETSRGGLAFTDWVPRG